MIPRRLPVTRPLTTAIQAQSRSSAARQTRCAQTAVNHALDDPSMNGGYVNPPPQKRALRDPYAGWWDPQERRNFGEPIHEDNDVLSVFSTEPYTHASPGKAALHFGAFVSAVLALCAVVYQMYPDKPSTPKEYPRGLETEMGGPRALVARKKAEEDLITE